MELGADPARFENVAQIAGEAIADIEHRVNGKILRQPTGFVQTRLEIKMFAGKRTAQLTTHKNGVANFRAGAKHIFSASD